MIACLAWLAVSTIALLAPAYYETAFRVSQPAVLGEMAFALWLLIKGPNLQVLPQGTSL